MDQLGTYQAADQVSELSQVLDVFMSSLESKGAVLIFYLNHYNRTTVLEQERPEDTEQLGDHRPTLSM